MVRILTHHQQEFIVTYYLQKGENTSLEKIDDFVIVIALGECYFIKRQSL